MSPIPIPKPTTDDRRNKLDADIEILIEAALALKGYEDEIEDLERRMRRGDYGNEGPGPNHRSRIAFIKQVLLRPVSDFIDHECARIPQEAFPFENPPTAAVP